MTTDTVQAKPRSRSRTLNLGLGKNPLPRIGFWLLILVIIVYLLFPFYWAFRTSITPDAALYVTPVQYFPAHPTGQNYVDVFNNGNFTRALLNSALVGVAVTVISLIVGASAAYALARFRFRGRSFVAYLTLSMTIFPQVAILGALYKLISTFGLYDSLWALVLTYMLFTLPFTVWVLTSFFRQLPKELEEAAYVDGANPLQTFYKIMLPLAAPGMVTTGLLALISAWNEFLYALSFEFSPDHFTVPVSINNFTSTAAGASQFNTPWGDIMAATVVVTIPLVALVLIFQRRIIAGLTAGAVKG
jgi:trehalose/maltose transport system permease protein